MAWNYALCWLVIFPFELLCGAYVMAYWVPHERVRLSRVDHYILRSHFRNQFVWCTRIW